MYYRLLFLLVGLQLFSQSANNAAASGVAALTALYQIDVGERGTEIVNTFNSLAHASGTLVPEIALQTNLFNPIPYTTYKYISNGIISYVQNLTETTHNTLLIVTYQSPKAPTVSQYVVLPVEQVTALLYFPNQTNLPTSSAPFTASVINGTLPYYSVDPKERAADIVYATNKLLNAPFKTSPLTQIWIQTTLTGPFNPAVPGGLLRNVTSISVSNSLIRINFLPPNQSTTLSVFVSPEQVQQITYLLNYNNP